MTNFIFIIVLIIIVIIALKIIYNHIKYHNYFKGYDDAIHPYNNKIKKDLE